MEADARTGALTLFEEATDSLDWRYPECVPLRWSGGSGWGGWFTRGGALRYGTAMPPDCWRPYDGEYCEGDDEGVAPGKP